MTTLQAAWIGLRPAASSFGRTRAIPGLRHAVEIVSVSVALLVFAWALGRQGGQEPSTMTWTLLFTLPAAVLARPWRHLPLWAVGLAVAIPTAALLVALVDPLGFTYTQDLGVWPYAAELFLIAAGFARRTDLRNLLAGGVCLVGSYQFLKALLPWPAWADNTHPMVGTFYSRNQYGGFAAALAIFGAALLFSEVRSLRWLGALTAFTCGVGALLSFSAASIALLAIGTVIVLATSIVAGCRRFARTAALGSVAVLSIAFAFGLRTSVGSPPSTATPTWIPSTYGIARVSASRFDDVRARLHYWNIAWHDFLASPLTGHGHGWFGLHFGQTLRPGEFFSRWAHSGVLQALADGGLLFGLPVIAATAVLLVIAVRRVARSRRLATADPIALGAALAVGILALHAQFDFDWNYPVLAGLLGLLGGLMLTSDRSATHPASAQESAGSASSVGASSSS